MEFLRSYLKILKINPGAYIFQKPFLRGLFLEGLSTDENLHFKIDWASLIVGTKFTVFASFNFVFQGNFPNRSPQGGFWRGHLMEGFLRYRCGGGLYLEELIHGRSYFQNFTVCACMLSLKVLCLP